MRKVFAKYAADSRNIWEDASESWIDDNAAEYREFIYLVHTLQRRTRKNRGVGLAKGINKYFTKNKYMSRTDAVVKWAEYDKFRDNYYDYCDGLSKP